MTNHDGIAEFNHTAENACSGNGAKRDLFGSIESSRTLSNKSSCLRQHNEQFVFHDTEQLKTKREKRTKASKTIENSNRYSFATTDNKHSNADSYANVRNFNRTFAFNNRDLSQHKERLSKTKTPQKTNKHMRKAPTLPDSSQFAISLMAILKTFVAILWGWARQLLYLFILFFSHFQHRLIHRISLLYRLQRRQWQRSTRSVQRLRRTNADRNQTVYRPTQPSPMIDIAAEDSFSSSTFDVR